MKKSGVFPVKRRRYCLAHPTKTHITKLTRGFVFLKKKFTYDRDTGRVVVRPCRESVSRERRKLKRQAGLVTAGKMTPDALRQSYQSWRGSMVSLDAHRTVLAMDALYADLAVGHAHIATNVRTALPDGGQLPERSSEWTR